MEAEHFNSNVQVSCRKLVAVVLYYLNTDLHFGCLFVNIQIEKT